MLIVDELHSSYGSAEILRGVSLEVGEGECVVMLGRNGLGKTSLVRSIVGMTPPVVRSGKVSWRDEPITGLPSYEVAQRGIGLVPQGRHIFGSLTVEENLTVTARSANGNGAGWSLDSVFEFFPALSQRSSQRGADLSGGEQQMLAIGRALMTNPSLLLMDEPSEGLAPKIVSQIREFVTDLRAQKLSIFLVEQNLGLAMRTADRLYILGDNGRVAWEGTPEQLEANDEVKQSHLGV
jgi:branched-chain amino acid transport system ATP-binding protein